MIGHGWAALVVGGVLMCVGSLLPFGFSDGGDFGLHDSGAVYGFRYGGPILGRLSDWAGASRWVGDAWIMMGLGVVVVGLASRARRRQPSFVVVLTALIGMAVAIYEWSYWISESGTSPTWTEYHNGVGPGPFVTAIGALTTVCFAAVLRMRWAPHQDPRAGD